MKNLLYTTISLVILWGCTRNETVVPIALNGDHETNLVTPVDTISPNSLTIAANEGFFGIYTGADAWKGCKINSPNTIRVSSGVYIRLLSDEDKNKIGDSVELRLELKAGYDEWDRYAAVYYFKTPRNSTVFNTIDHNKYTKTSLLTYTTPYFLHNSTPNRITYKENISKFAEDLRDFNSDVYIVYRIDANAGLFLPSGLSTHCDYPGFYVDIFFDTYKTSVISKDQNRIYTPLLSKELMTGEEVTHIKFTLSEDIENAELIYVSSGHGDEEGYNRQHILTMDGSEVASFDSKILCTPAEYYDSINPHGARGPNTTWRYPSRNWCQGAKINHRVFNIGSLKAGEHTLKVDVQKITDRGFSIVNLPSPINGNLPTNIVLIGEIK